MLFCYGHNYNFILFWVFLNLFKQIFLFLLCTCTLVLHCSTYVYMLFANKVLCSHHRITICSKYLYYLLNNITIFMYNNITYFISIHHVKIPETPLRYHFLPLTLAMQLLPTPHHCPSPTLHHPHTPLLTTARLASTAHTLLTAAWRPWTVGLTTSTGR